jgi:carbonic anhydrase
MKQTKLLLLTFSLCNLFAIKSSGQECSGCSGVNQSPVDIKDAVSLKTPLNIRISDNTESLETIYSPNAANAINIEVEIADHHHGYSLTFNGIVYKYSNVHYHLQSEHKVNGKPYSMEAHFVFKSEIASQGAVVIGMLINKADKEHHAFAILDSLVQGMQNTAQKLPDTTYTYHFSKSVTSASFVLGRFLKGGYFSYTGSLTTPTYSEGITWIVLSQPQYIDNRYFEMFDALQKKYNYGKARALQPINNRVIVSAAASK